MEKQPQVNGTLILVLGLLGIIVLPPLALFAWSMGTTAIGKLDAAGIRDGSERANANIGRVCGIVGSFLWLGLLLLRLMASSN